MRPSRALLLPVAALAGVLAALRWSPIGRYAVEGPSMEPAYRDGDRVMVNRLAYLRQPPAVGDVVVLRDPERHGRYLLKRIAQAPDHEDPGPARLYVLGDNAAESRDSRQFDTVARRTIIGRACLRY